MQLIYSATITRHGRPLGIPKGDATNGTQERGNGIQGEMAGDAWAAAEQQLVAFEGCGASVRSMRSRIKGWERYANKENTENMKKEGRKVPEM